LLFITKCWGGQKILCPPCPKVGGDMSPLPPHKLGPWRQGIQGEGVNINRKWVTYYKENETLHCSFCLMYAPKKSRNMQMIQGCSDWRHLTTRLFEHEKSHCHKHSTDAYFPNACERSIKHILLKEWLSLKTQQALQRRSVLKCAIDVIFYIGFQGLPYRSKHREFVATAFDESKHDNRRNHDNVWHVIMLCCYYQHVSMNIMSLKFSNLFIHTHVY